MNRYSILALAGLLIAAPALAAGANTAGAQLVALADTSSDFSAGQQALDAHDWARARRIFGEIAAGGGKDADAALYWKAYAQSRAHDYPAALKSVQELASTYPHSKWRDDAEALAVEMGKKPGRDDLSDNEELKLYALQAMMMTHPEKATRLVRKIVEQGKSDELKKRALFVLMQAHDADTSNLLSNVIAGPASLPVKVAAVRTLGAIGDKQSLDILDKTYAGADNDTLKKSVLQAYMMSNHMERVHALVTREKDPELRRLAIRMLAARGEIKDLESLYDKEKDPRTREVIAQGFAMAGDGKMVVRIIKTDKDPKVRIAAIHGLMMIDDNSVLPDLGSLYSSATGEDEKQAIVQALAMHDQVDTLIGIFHKEKNPDIKRQILQSLAMFSKSPKAEKFIESLVEGQ
jgi:outer membrane protein assembly factor BamD (BamD/ComL family)